MNDRASCMIFVIHLHISGGILCFQYGILIFHTCPDCSIRYILCSLGKMLLYNVLKCNLRHPRFLDK